VNADRAIFTRAAGEPSPSVSYVRQARRLRAIWRREPAKLHRELRELAKPPQPSVPASLGPAEKFARLVMGQVQGGVLRYSARLELLRQAAAMGIERFEANLIIAAVEHRVPRPTAGRRIALRTEAVSRTAIVATVVAVQAMIVLAAWWMVGG
jgi:hypothetical protein